tara:strand:- start:10175 stop:10369 length:195 start_codon:yes stop_codon:yes gene_type:complete
MTRKINSPANSKINANAAFTSITNVGIYVLANQGLIPQDAVIDALVIGNVISQALQSVFRTWFT